MVDLSTLLLNQKKNVGKRIGQHHVLAISIRAKPERVEYFMKPVSSIERDFMKRVLSIERDFMITDGRR